MTHDWHDVLGDARPTSPPSDSQTADFDSVFAPFDVPRTDRVVVRNVLVRERGGGASAWKARAAIDDVRRSLISWLVVSEGDGARDEGEFYSRFVEHLLQPSGSMSGTATSGGAVSEDIVEAANTAGAVDPDALDAARKIALGVFPPGSTVEWSDDVDENGQGLKVMTITSSGPSAAIHEAYLAFVRAWAQAESPDRRRFIRVTCRAGVPG